MSVRNISFASFLQAGFECSTHRYGNRRLDLLEATGHTRLVVQDLLRLRDFGIRTIRTGARWHLIEETPHEYRFESLETILRAADETGVEVLLDLFHFGWPDHLDIFDAGFPAAYDRYVRAVAHYMRRWPGVCGAYAPVNEVSFLSWIAGDVANFYPHCRDRGKQLKAILMRCAIAGSKILLQEIPGARLISPEPVINIVGREDIPGDDEAAAAYSMAQYEAWDMLSGRIAPELGGRPEYLDVVGINFYDRNQWVNYRETLYPENARYKPFRKMLAEVWERYRRPIFISETGAEDDTRAPWFRYVWQEVEASRQEGIPVQGICLYPILNHPGWEDDRHCRNGLFDYPDENGNREVYQPLADEIFLRQEKLRNSSTAIHDLPTPTTHLFVPSALGLRTSEAPTPDESVCS